MQRLRSGRGQIDVEAGDDAAVGGLDRRVAGVAEAAQLLGVGADGDERRQAGEHADAQDAATRDRRQRLLGARRRSGRDPCREHACDGEGRATHQCLGRYDFDSSAASSFCARRRSVGEPGCLAARLSAGVALRPT